MVRMAKKVKVKKEKRNVTQPTTTTEASDSTPSPTESAPTSKPRRVKPAPKDPVTKADFTVAAGRVQSKINNIEANYQKAITTATNRVNAKYRALVKGELEGLKEGVVERLVVPEFAADDVLAELVEGEEFVEITTDLDSDEAVAEEAAE